ncbi:MAG: hypothetical protein WC380_00295 [Pedobacter sp.]|jgi:hypothetical protein
MADAELKVRIDAEIGNFSSNLKKGEQDLSKFSDKVNADLKKTAQNAAAVSAQLGGSVAKGANQAGFALQNLGRVAQDAPFGFIGIQNNLNPLLESFQSLKAQTGSTSLAFKALGASLLGPAGIGIALSVVSSAILLYQQYQQRANKETKVAVDANKELSDSILNISDVRAKAITNASKELSTFQTLFKSTQNANIPLAERLKIAKELIDRYPKYLKGITAEGVLAGQAADAYEKLTNAILAKGLAQAGEENRQKLINQQLQTSVDKRKEEANLLKLNTSLQRKSVSSTDLLGQEGTIALLGVIQKEAEKSKQKIAEYTKTLETGANEIKVLDEVTQDLIKTFGSEILFDDKKPKKLNKEVKTISDILKQLDVDFKKVSASVDITFGDGKKEKIKAIAKAIDDLIAIGIKGDNPIVTRLQNQIQAIGPSEFKPALANLGSQISQSIGQSIGQGAVDNVDLQGKLIKPFDAWGDYVNNNLLPKIQGNFEQFFNKILETGTISFQSLGKAILSTLASVAASEAAAGLVNLFKVNTGQDYTDSKKKGGLGFALAGLFAKKAVATGGATSGAAATVATGTAASGGLLLPILGGIAAVAGIASLFKKKQPAPQPAYSTSTASTSSASSVDFGGGRVVFEISGVNLVGVLNRAGAKLQRFGP